MAKSNIVVVGLLKEPKQEFAKVLAEKLEMCFVDSNEVVNNKVEEKTKEVLDSFGAKYYADIEKQVLKMIENYENTVILVNLNTVFAENNLEKLKKNAFIIYLQINSKVFKKLKNLESTDINKSKLIMNEIVFAERDKLYCENSDIVVDGSSLKVKKMIKGAIKGIKNYYKKLGK